MSRDARIAALVACTFAVSAGCMNRAASTREAKLVVLAATSLRDVFTSLGEAFERTHPGVTVTLVFGGTQELRTQLEHGAPATALPD